MGLIHNIHREKAMSATISILEIVQNKNDRINIL